VLCNKRKDRKMKDSKTLLLEYLASVRDPERAASLFAEDGAFELPFLRSLGVELATLAAVRSWGSLTSC
jgi:hypothetical protein